MNKNSSEVGKLHSSGVAVKSLVSQEQGVQPTERPWRIKNSSSHIATERVRILGADGLSVGSTAAYRSAGEAEANAELIVRSVNGFDKLLQQTKSLNETVSILLNERYQLRQLSIDLLSYVKDNAPYNPYGEDRVAEESQRRLNLMAEADERLFNTASVIALAGKPVTSDESGSVQDSEA